MSLFRENSGRQARGTADDADFADGKQRGHQVESQRQYPVQYKGELIGSLVPDLIVDNLVIADPKVAAAFSDTHSAQMLGYLSITDLQLAILLNFKHAKLQWKRFVREASAQTTEALGW